MFALIISWVVSVVILWIALYTAWKVVPESDSSNQNMVSRTFAAFDTTNWVLFVLGSGFLIASVFQTIDLVSR